MTAHARAYYNEFDPFAAAWLRELIKAGHIAPGEVDERSIEDVLPTDLRGFTQCHFFAGIGVWSYALRQAVWSDDRPVWTGSCPCQPFSAAGKGAGFTDERHLWPAWFHLIEQCKPVVIFGEQVEAAIRQGWLGLVQNDLEGIGYRFALHGVAACNLGAPHIRKRLYFVADALRSGRAEGRAVTGNRQTAGRCGLGELADTDDARSQKQLRDGRNEPNAGQLRPSPVGGVVNATCEQMGIPGRARESRATGGFWGNAEWIYCRDEKYRPIEPGTFPLAHGSPNRVGRLRGYGNAIVAPVAQAFIEAFLDTERELNGVH